MNEKLLEELTKHKRAIKNIIYDRVSKGNKISNEASNINCLQAEKCKKKILNAYFYKLSNIDFNII